VTLALNEVCVDFNLGSMLALNWNET
jgi:hypothetical protein